MDQQAQSNHTFFTDDQLREMIGNGQFGKVSEEQKQQAIEHITKKVLEAVFQRVAHVLTEEDMEEFESYDKSDTSGNTARLFLLQKVPGLDAIINEEIRFFKEEITGTPNKAYA